MSADANSARVLDASIRQRWPRPVASAWGRAAVAQDPFERVDRLLSFTEILFRTLAVVGIADYLSAPPTSGRQTDRDHPERLLETLTRPADGHWHKLGCLLPIACSEREQGAFVPEFASWLTLSDPTHPDRNRAGALGWLVKLRNDARHGSTPDSPDAAARRAHEYESTLRALLSEMMWLAEYRFGRIVDAAAMSVEGSFRGTVEFWYGTDELPERVNAIWRGWLPEGSVWLFSPDASRALLVSPMVQVRSTENHPVDRFFMLKKVYPRSGDLLLVDDRSAESIDSAPPRPACNEKGPRSWFDPGSRIRTPVVDVEGKLCVDAPMEGLSRARVAGKYTLHEVLGRGGMGTVFRATHTFLGEEVALKVLNSDLSNDPVVVERFLREARLMHGLRSANVLQAIDTGRLEDGRLYIASRIAQGGSLADVVASGPSAPERVSRWLIQAASGLSALHALGVVHRDIKPANILLDGDTVLISDLGIAKPGDGSNLTATIEQLGTRAYMAPEQLRGHPASTRTDIYSLGLVAHELLTGSRSDWRVGQGIPGKLGALIRRMCDEDPDERPTALGVARVLSDPRELEAPQPNDQHSTPIHGSDLPTGAAYEGGVEAYVRRAESVESGGPGAAHVPVREADSERLQSNEPPQGTEPSSFESIGPPARDDGADSESVESVEEHGIGGGTVLFGVVILFGLVNLCGQC